jgi:hypothetical protein
MSMTTAVVIVTSGRAELENAVLSVRQQTRQVDRLYIVTDGIVGFDDYCQLRDDYKTDSLYGSEKTSVSVSYWDGKIGGAGLEGRRLFAAAPGLVNEDILFMLPDDDWFGMRHVEDLAGIIEEGKDWAYSLMKVYDKDGKFLFDDICECLGEEHPAYNTGVNFAPTGSIAMKTPLYANIASVYNSRDWGPDRLFYDTAKRMYPKFRGSKNHTNCFRLGGNEGSSTAEFFLQGNKLMREHYGDKMPWQK